MVPKLRDLLPLIAQSDPAETLVRLAVDATVFKFNAPSDDTRSSACCRRTQVEQAYNKVRTKHMSWGAYLV